MRKFLIRWWYTSNYPQDLHARLMHGWNHAGLRDVLKESLRAAFHRPGELGIEDLVRLGVVRVESGQECLDTLARAVGDEFGSKTEHRWVN